MLSVGPMFIYEHPSHYSIPLVLLLQHIALKLHLLSLLAAIQGDA